MRAHIERRTNDIVWDIEREIARMEKRIAGDFT